MIDPISYHVSVGKISYDILEFPLINSLHPAVSILQHITKKPSKIVYLNLRKASIIRVMAILRIPAPVLGGV